NSLPAFGRKNSLDGLHTRGDPPILSPLRIAGRQKSAQTPQAARALVAACAEVVMPRLFTGVELPPSIGQSLAMMRGGLPGARWSDPENYHLTLRFIGDIDDALAREIAGVLGRVHRHAFDLRLDGLTS